MTRYNHRNQFWIPLRDALRIATNTRGAQKLLANRLGIPPSQIHRYTCQNCEHDQEPTFSIGMAIFAYLQSIREAQKNFTQ